MIMKVYLSHHRNLQGELTPIVVETNMQYAIPYWKKRQQVNPKLFWEFVSRSQA